MFHVIIVYVLSAAAGGVVSVPEGQKAPHEDCSCPEGGVFLGARWTDQDSPTGGRCPTDWYVYNQ